MMKISFLILLFHFSSCLSSPAPVEDILPHAAGPRKWNQTRIELLKTFNQQVQADLLKVYFIFPIVQSGHIPESFQKNHKLETFWKRKPRFVSMEALFRGITQRERNKDVKNKHNMILAVQCQISNKNYNFIHITMHKTQTQSFQGYCLL